VTVANGARTDNSSGTRSWAQIHKYLDLQGTVNQLSLTQESCGHGHSICVLVIPLRASTSYSVHHRFMTSVSRPK